MSSVARAAGSSGPSPSWIKQTSSPTSLSTDPHDVTQHLSQTASDIKTAPGNAYSRNSILARDMPSMVYTKNGQASTPAPGGQNPPSYGMSPLLRQGSKNFHYTASDSPLSASTAVGSGNMRQQAAYARSLSAEGGAETNVQHRADTASSLHGDNTSSLYAASTAAKTQATLATDAQEAVPRRPPNTAVLSRHSIMTQAKNRPGRFQHSAVSKNSGNQLFSRAADQTDAHKTHSASLQSGSSKKRKALGEETPESVDDLSTYYNSPAFYYDAERRHAANLGSSTTAAGLQSKQLMSAAQHQASFAPNYSAIAHSWTQNADGFISSSPRVKRRKLMRASSSWGSSDSVAATLDPTLGPSATHGPPTAGFAQDSIWRPTSPLFANSVLHPTGHPTSAAAHPGTDPRTPFHAPAGVTTTPHAHHAANPSAAPEAPAVNAVPGLLHAPGLPQGVHREPHQVPGPARGSNSTCPAAPQDASHQTKYIAPPQAASHDPLVALSQAAASTEPRVHPQAYPLARTHAPSQGPAAALVKRAGYQEGQLVWGKCRGHPWWPATVSHLFTVGAFIGITLAYMSWMALFMSFCALSTTQFTNVKFVQCTHFAQHCICWLAPGLAFCTAPFSPVLACHGTSPSLLPDIMAFETSCQFRKSLAAQELHCCACTVPSM